MRDASNKRLGYFFIIIGVCLYSFSDAIMQYFMQTYDVNQITFLRTVFRFIPLLLFAFYKKINPLKTKKIKENIFRSILASIGTYAFMLAYKYATMTDVIVIGYSTALFIIPLSIFILKERFYIQDGIAVVIGFLGVLLAFRPFCDVLQFGITFALVGAIIAALNQVIIKKLSKTDSELTIIFYHHLTLILISFFIGFDSFSSLKDWDFYFLFAGGCIGAVAQYCIIHAFKLSTSSNLASATYTMLIPVTLIDFFMYKKIPDLFIICGLILIALGSFQVLKRKKQIKNQNKSSTFTK